MPKRLYDVKCNMSQRDLANLVGGTFLEKSFTMSRSRSDSSSARLIIPFLSDYSKVKDSALHGVPQKRQLSMLSPMRVDGIALPIVSEAINSAAKTRAYATSGTGYYPNSNLMGYTFGWPGYYLRTPYPSGRGFAPFRVPVSQSPLRSILSGKRNLVGPSRAILQSIKPLYSYGLKRFTI